jgi:predicted aminopeptidase
MRFVQALLLVSITPGCAEVGYLAQAARGQLALLDSARPISALLRGEEAPPKLKRMLAEIPRIRAFGAEQGLAISDQYQTYAPLDREAAVWVVVASEPLAFEEVTWSFPLVGSFPYLGFFDQRDARAEAARLTELGKDAYVRGASAYSTLGWFSDPVLSTMFRGRGAILGRLANIVLHESVHATAYVNGQGPFNESIARFTAGGLTPLYLRRTYGADSVPLQGYIAGRRERRVEEELLLHAYRELAALYAGPTDAATKLVRKRQIFAKLGRDLDSDEPLNNGTLIDFRTYRTGEAELAGMFEQCGHSWTRFIAALAEADESLFTEEQQESLGPVIETLARRGCGGGQRPPQRE